MATDPVCGMSVDKNSAPAKADYQGQTYYFCSTGCQTKFQQAPQKYVQPQTHTASPGQATG